MRTDALSRPGAWVPGDEIERANASLRALAETAARAEGAFARLIGQVTAAPPLPQTDGTMRGLVDDLVREVDLAGRHMAEGILRSNERAVDRSLDLWDRFGDRIGDLFADLFGRIARDGEIRLSSLVRAVLPMLTGLVRDAVGSIGGSIGGSLGGLIGGTAGGSFGGALSDPLLRIGSSLVGLVAGGGGSLGGILGGGLGGIGALNPYLGGALTLAQILGPMFLSGRPSVGPTTVARVTPSTGDVDYSTDNGGDPDALVATVDAIFDAMDRVRSRFGGVFNGNGFDIGYFPNPEDGSGQTGGYNFKAIIAGQAEDEDRFRGLGEAELIAEAVRFIVREGLDGIDVPEVAEAARHSVADSLEALFDDLTFAERFGWLRAALDDAGQGIDAYTVALQRQRLEITEAGRALATDGVTAIRDFLDRTISLFPGEAALRGGSDLSGVDASTIGAPAAGQPGRLLYQQDEGSRRFEPGVSGDYDPRTGNLTGLTVGGRVLSLAARRTDEGRPLDGDSDPDQSLRMVAGTVTIATGALEDMLAAATDLAAVGAEAETVASRALANQQRVRDAFAIAAADVDGLIERIAGGFEPETIGPFEERLIAGNGAIEQLRSELERFNEDIAAAKRMFPELGVVALDVAAMMAEASDLLRARVQADYRNDVARDLREARGLGVQDEVSDLDEAYRARRADGEAVGITDFSDLDALFRERLRALLDGAEDLGEVLGEVGASFADLSGLATLLPEVLAELGRSFSDDLERDTRAAAGTGVVDDVSDRLAEIDRRRAAGEALGVEDLSGLDTILRQQLAELFETADLTPAAVEALRTGFADNALVLDSLAGALDLSLEAANDNAIAQFSVADATRLATREIALQIQQQELLAGTADRVLDSLADTRRRISSDPNLSALSPAQQLEDGRRFFESLAERSAAGDQEAQLELGTAALEYLQLARSYYASNQDYARIFAEVDGALGDTQSVAERQLTVAQAQLRELETISRSLSGDLSGVPNPNADFGLAPTRNRIIARLTGYAGDFGDGGFSAFRPGLSDALNDAVDLLVQTIPFASGGVMTARGPLALHRYASGGVADTPQLALFGEGRHPEAFVPLPDGRSIPVTIARPEPDDRADGHDSEMLADLIDETRRVTEAINGLRVDNTALRRGLERVLAASRGAGRAA